MNVNLSAGAGVVILLNPGGTSVQVQPAPGKDPGGVWGKHKSVLLRADSAGATVYFGDPATGVDGVTLAASESISIDYAGPLWVNSTGTVTVVALG